MNEKRRKIRGFSKRVLALMLCGFCLLAMPPTFATTVEGTGSQPAEENMLGCSCEGNGVQTYDLDQGGYQLSMGYFNPDSQVYYMVVTSTPAVYEPQNVVSDVTLSGAAVANASSTSSDDWSGGQTLGTYYPGVETGGTDTNEPLSIKPADGYYVTRVVVSCCGPSGATSPFDCETWAANNAYEKAFSVSSQGTVTTDLPSSAFGHSSDSSVYFILIRVAPIPSPLYVEYDYGNIDELLGDRYAGSVFASADQWTKASTANVYKPTNDSSDGGVQTNYTQLTYTYAVTDEMTDAEKAAAVQSWSHTTNTVTQAAQEAAASAGYYFAGWAYTYYNEVTVTENGSGSYNNYTYTFSDEYGMGTVGQNEALELTTNVRLVAQWKPIQLKVTKTVDGLNEISEFTNKEQTYTLVLQKLQDDDTAYVQLTKTEFSITGDGSLTYTYGAVDANVSQVITPGRYRIVETGDYTLDGETVQAVCTTTYPVETVEVQADGRVTELQVLNEYAASYSLTVCKTVSGNFYDASKAFAFTVTYNGKTESFQLSKGQSHTVAGIPVGATVTVSEDPDGYQHSLASITEEVSTTDVTNGVSFTMPAKNVTVTINNEKNVLVDTGVFLDTLPYLVILGVVTAGTVLLVKKTGVRDED